VTGSRAVALLSLLALSATAAGKRGDVAPCALEAVQVLEVQGSTLCVFIQDAALEHNQAQLKAWILRSAQIVAGYYGRFPAARVSIRIDAQAGDAVGGGNTNNDPELSIHVNAGREVSAATLTNDWVLVHEMIHLALPEVGRRHNWLAEGLATYVEGIARAQAGNRPILDVWTEYRHSMPRGLPRPGEGGLDETHNWGRTYWGGALFCLQADVSIREQSHNRVGLQQALRAILQATGGYASERDLVDVLHIGDEATHTAVLSDLYDRNKATAVNFDLAGLWAQLGIHGEPDSLQFDDQAPLAAIRAAITAPRPAND
jgi:hypothetical protein